MRKQVSVKLSMISTTHVPGSNTWEHDEEFIDEMTLEQTENDDDIQLYWRH